MEKKAETKTIRTGFVTAAITGLLMGNVNQTPQNIASLAVTIAKEIELQLTAQNIKIK